MPLTIQRIMKLVRISDTGCWEWMRRRDKDGYGRVGVDGKTFQAHRATYMALVGCIPEGLCIDHLCRNKACVNPAHLEPVTVRENVLRGNKPTVVTGRKTHCRWGHSLSGDNVYVWRGMHHCRVCHRIRMRVTRGRKVMA